MIDVVAVGELIIDFASIETDKAGYPTMKANPGGAPANFLATLNKYGFSTAMIGKVGADTFGDLLLNTLKEAGINTNGMVRDTESFTTLAFVTFNSLGERTFSFARKPGADTRLKFEEIDLDFLDETKILHFGTLSLTNDPARTATYRAVEYARKKGKLITFDPNYRPSLWESFDAAREQILWGLKHADFVKISDEEIEFLWNCSLEVGMKKILDEYNAKMVLLTMGKEGAIAITKSARGVAKCPIVNPIDTTGAGDICGGSAISRIMKLGKELTDLTEDDLIEIASFATTAASLSTEIIGGIPSILNEEEVVLRMP